MNLVFTLNGKKQTISSNNEKYQLDYPCNFKETCSTYEKGVPRGKHKFDVFGAGGGSYESGNEGSGGFSTRILLRREETHIFSYTRFKGICAKKNEFMYSTRAFNNGGNGILEQC